MGSNELISKFTELKNRQTELTAEKVKYETKLEQLNNEIKVIQNKYSDYNLSSAESVEKIISDLTIQLTNELADINAQYEKIKAM
jgi:uncharacterized protein YlxW (UPF0749 family)